jgi:hypothetical protein
VEHERPARRARCSADDFAPLLSPWVRHGEHRRGAWRERARDRTGCIVGRQSESVSLEINGRQCLASTLPRHDNPSSAGDRSEDRAAAPLDVRVD